VAAVLMAALALWAGISGWIRLGDSSSGALGTTPGRAGDPVAGPATTRAALAQAARPIGLTIRSIGVSAVVRPVGISSDRTVEVPDHPENVGWYSLGAIPGQAGSAVLLGHVDSVHGPAVFARLHSLSKGARIDVVGSDGSATHFEVTRSATYANEDFPARRVYRSTGRAGVTLVTCGGRYDAAHGGYQANVVVYAVLVGSSRAAPTS
jgi:hypothetical protein